MRRFTATRNIGSLYSEIENRSELFIRARLPGPVLFSLISTLIYKTILYLRYCRITEMLRRGKPGVRADWRAFPASYFCVILCRERHKRGMI
jgi:hypothetical protein